MLRKLSCQKTKYTKGEEVLFSITEKDIRDLIIELELLLYSKIDKLLVEDVNTRRVYKLSLSDDNKKSYFNIEHFEIVLSRNNAEYIVSYMLTYILNYSVEVNHIQFELLDNITGKYACEFVLFLDL